jgi:hypothetical protein
VNGRLPNHDHLRELVETPAPSYETIVDVSGGNAATRYFVAGSWKRDNAIIPNTGAGRQGLRLNLDQRLNDRVNLAVSSVYNRSEAQRGFTNNDNSGAGLTYALAYIPGFIPLEKVDGEYPRPAVTYLGSNPLQTAALMRNEENVNRFTGSATLRAQALATERHDLQLVAAAGADVFNQRNEVFAPPELYFQETEAFPGISTLSNGDSRFLNWNLNAVYAYNPTRLANRLTTSAGLQYEDRALTRSRVAAEGLLPGQSNIDQGSVLRGQFEQSTEERTIAFYAQEQVMALNERLLVDLGLRAERSSVFGNTDKYYVFPKASASYRFSDLLGAGNELKFRGAYGITGNQPLFGQKFTTLTGGNVVGGNVGTIVGTTAGAPEIKPERVQEIEGGVDVTALNRRATLELTVFQRKTTDLLLSSTPAPSTGFSQVILNGGELQNWGVEVAFGATPLQSTNFTWLFQSTFNALRNKVVSLPVPAFEPANAGFGLAYGEFFVEPGAPISQIIGIVGYEEDGETPIVRRLGEANPDFTWSFTNDFTYRGVNLSFLLDWQKGGAAQNQTMSLYDCNNLAPDGNTEAGQARYRACNFDGIATPFVQSTTFLKLREVRLAYSLPQRWAAAVGGAESLRLEATGRNLWVDTDYFGYDPESSNYGQQAITRNIDLGPYPPSRSFFFGIAAGF